MSSSLGKSSSTPIGTHWSVSNSTTQHASIVPIILATFWWGEASIFFSGLLACRYSEHSQIQRLHNILDVHLKVPHRRLHQPEKEMGSWIATGRSRDPFGLKELPVSYSPGTFVCSFTSGFFSAFSYLAISVDPGKPAFWRFDPEFFDNFSAVFGKFFKFWAK